MPLRQSRIVTSYQLAILSYSNGYAYNNRYNGGYSSPYAYNSNPYGYGYNNDGYIYNNGYGYNTGYGNGYSYRPQPTYRNSYYAGYRNGVRADGDSPA